MFDKYNLIVKHLFEKSFLETWRMEMSLWPLLEAEIYLYSKVTSTMRQSSQRAKGLLSVCLHIVDVSALWRREKTEAADG